MTTAKQHRQSKERHQRWSKEASEKRFAKNAITYGDAIAQTIAAGEQVGDLPLYKVSRKAAELIATTNWQDRK